MAKKSLKIEHTGYVLLPRKTMKDKKVSINLNIYRNLHPMVENQCKRIVKDNVKKYLKDTGQDSIRLEGPVKATFQYCKPTKRRLDKSNVFAIATKYIYDALVELEILVDDNDDYIKEELLLPTIYEKNVSNITILIEEL